MDKTELIGNAGGGDCYYTEWERKNTRRTHAPDITEKIPSFLFSINKIIILTSL